MTGSSHLTASATKVLSPSVSNECQWNLLHQQSHLLVYQGIMLYWCIPLENL